MGEISNKLANHLCDHLMQEDIGSLTNKDAIDVTVELTRLAIELKRKDALFRALTWHESLEQRLVYGEEAILLDLSHANAIAGERYGTPWSWEQSTLAREIFYLRRAISNEAFDQAPVVIKCKLLNNVGNRLIVTGRIIEAIDFWRRTLDVRPNFGMALCNRARAFAEYANGLEDEDDKILLLWMAHKEATAAHEPAAIYTDVSDVRTLNAVKQLTAHIESILDVKQLNESPPRMTADRSRSDEDRAYSEWCLSHRLYVNPLNDLGAYPIGAADSIGLPTHIVPVDAPHRFSSFFDQMKQEYVSARWCLYEGLTTKKAHFSDSNVLLAATEPLPSLSLAVEQLKTAYRVAYSLFDKLGFFLNAYMNLGIPEKRVSFRTLWTAGEDKAIRPQFDLHDNWGFCALYWLAKDFSEKANDEVSEPQARNLSEIRNSIEHKYLRVVANEVTTAPVDDLALMVSRKRFEAKTLHLLKLARAALIYLAIGVRFEELRRQPKFRDVSLEDIPATDRLSDAQKL